jgi:hypothetical protein
MKTGAPYGQVFDAVDRGCKGGDNSSSNTGGRGGPIFTHIYDITLSSIIKNLDIMDIQVDRSSTSTSSVTTSSILPITGDLSIIL